MKLGKDRIDNKSKSGSMEITAENQDDIYMLSSIIYVGDMVTAGTRRKVQIDGKTQQKISLTLKIRIETISIDLENSIIYLKGKTVNVHEHVKLGSYHTIDIGLGQSFVLYKEEWFTTSIKHLKEATKPQAEIIFIVFYERECVVSVVSKNRINTILKQEIRNRKFGNIINMLEKYVGKVNLFVIASAFEIRNEFYKAVPMSKELKRVYNCLCVVKIPLECKGLPNSRVISTILTDKDLSKCFQGVQYVNDLKEIDNFFVDFAKESSLICVGMCDIREAMEYGALDKLMITDEIARPKTIEERREIEAFCKEMQSINCKIFIIPVAHFSGKRLREIGGMCGTLKFNYK